MAGRRRRPMPGSAWLYLNGETLLTVARLPGLRIRPVWVYEQCPVHVAPELRGGCDARHGPRPPVPACRMRRPPTRAAHTRPLGRGSRNGPMPSATGHCPQLPTLSPSTWAGWRRPAEPRPPSSWPGPPSPMPHAAAGIAKADNPGRAPTERTCPLTHREGEWRRL